MARECGGRGERSRGHALRRRLVDRNRDRERGEKVLGAARPTEQDARRLARERNRGDAGSDRRVEATPRDAKDHEGEQRQQERVQRRGRPRQLEQPRSHREEVELPAQRPPVERGAHRPQEVERPLEEPRGEKRVVVRDGHAEGCPAAGPKQDRESDRNGQEPHTIGAAGGGMLGVRPLGGALRRRRSLRFRTPNALGFRTLGHDARSREPASRDQRRSPAVRQVSRPRPHLRS